MCQDCVNLDNDYDEWWEDFKLALATDRVRKQKLADSFATPFRGTYDAIFVFYDVVNDILVKSFTDDDLGAIKYQSVLKKNYRLTGYTISTNLDEAGEYLWKIYPKKGKY